MKIFGLANIGKHMLKSHINCAFSSNPFFYKNSSMYYFFELLSPHNGRFYTLMWWIDD